MSKSARTLPLSTQAAELLSPPSVAKRAVLRIGRSLTVAAAKWAIKSKKWVGANDLLDDEAIGDPSALSEFRDWLSRLARGTVIELGTRRVDRNPSSVRRHWVPTGVRYLGCDFRAGEDVDLVADVESLSKSIEAGTVDAIIACSIFEHIRRPWIAVDEIAQVLRPGGRIFVQTHQCYPVHAHPQDYWRFSREALEVLFGPEAGFQNQRSWYDFPASILSQEAPITVLHSAFLNVCLVAEKTRSR